MPTGGSHEAGLHTLASLARRLPVGLMVLDRRGHLLYLNRWLIQFLGGEAEHFTRGQPVEAALRATLDTPAAENLLRTLRTGRAHAQEGQFQLRDGRTVQLRIAATPLRGERRAWLGTIVVVQDITDAALARHHRLTTKKALLALTDVDVYIMDAQGRIIFSNRFPETAVGQPLAQLPPPPGRSAHITRILSWLEAGSESLDDTLAAEDDRVFRLSLRHLTGDDGNVLGAVAFAVDVTAEVRLRERLRRAEWLEVIGELAATTAHELRNPLSAIRATAQLGLFVADAAQKDAALTRIVRDIDRLDRFIEELIALAAPEDEPLQPISLAEMVEDVLALVQGKLIVQGIEVRRLSDPSQLPPALLRRRLFRRALLQVVTNSVEAMPHGGILSFSSAFDERRRRLLLLVADTGVGMTSEQLARLFTPFQTSKSGAAGLGLAVAYQVIVRYHGGDLRYTSAPGQGTTAYIELPAAPPEPSTPTSTAPKEESP